jgi:hypothetical protein
VAGLIVEADFRAMFSISPDITSGQIVRHLGAASRRLKGWVGPDVYADAGNSHPTDPDRAADLQLAEAFLGMHFGIVGFNTRVDTSGVVKTKKMEGNTVVTFLGPAEVRALTQNYLDQAEEIARPYLLADGTPAPPEERVHARDMEPEIPVIVFGGFPQGAFEFGEFGEGGEGDEF